MTLRYMARLTVTIPDLVSDDLQRWADLEGRTKAGLTSYVIEAAVRDKFPENYPPPDAYKKGLQGTKRVNEGAGNESTLDPAAKQSVNPALVTAWGKLIDGEPLSPEEEELIAESCDRAPHNVHNLVKKIRSMGA